jgi:hypothetical protein
VTITDISWESDSNPLHCGETGIVTAKVSLEVGSPGEQSIRFKISLWDHDGWFDSDDELAEAANRPVLRATTGRVTKQQLSEPIEVFCSEAPDCELEGASDSSGEMVAEPYVYVQWADNNAEIKGWEKKPMDFECVVPIEDEDDTDVEEIETPEPISEEETEEPQPAGVVVVGSLFKDMNVNGVKDADEPVAPDLEVRIIELECGDACDPVAEVTSDDEGNYTLEYVPQVDTNYTLDVDWVGWQAYLTLLPTDNFVDLLGAASPGDTVSILPVGWVPMERTFTDPTGDNVIVGTDDPIDNPNGDIESVTVEVTLDGSIRIQIDLADNDLLDSAYSWGQFVTENRNGTITTYTHHKSPEGFIDKGQMDGGSGGRPNIVESDAEVELGSYYLPAREIPSGPPPFYEVDVDWYYQPGEGDGMSHDSSEIPEGNLDFVEFWLDIFPTTLE